MVNQHTDIIDNKLPRKNDLSGNRKSIIVLKMSRKKMLCCERILGLSNHA